MSRTGLLACPDRPGGLSYAALILLLAIPCPAAVNGVVTNQTTGKPQPGATVGLYKVATQTGLEMIDQAKTDAKGAFSIDRTLQGPHLIRTAYDGVTYNHMLPPGRPTTGLSLDVYNASTKPGESKVGKHMILFEPGGGQVSVNETFLLSNTGKTAWNDADNGTVKFFVPAGAAKPTVQATAPGGMPIGAAVKPTSAPDVFAVDFPVKPGDTRIDVSFTAPYVEGADYIGKVPTKDDNTYLIVPSGVTMKAEGLNDLGTEPRTQAHIYGLSGANYKVELTGSAAPADSQADSDSGPRIEQIMPRVNSKAPYILAIAFGILALGFALLYRAQESHDRGRR